MKKLMLSAFVLLVCLSANASTIVVSSELGIAANGLIDWTVFGTDHSGFLPVPSAFNLAVPGLEGLGVDIYRGAVASGGTMRRADNDFTFDGNFGPGEALLHTWRLDNPSEGPLSLTFDFDHPIEGMGAQVAANWYGGFTATIEAFNGLGASLGSYDLAGNVTPINDDSALFIGILSDTQDIDRVTFSVFSPNALNGNPPDEFVINGPRIVPEPATMTLLFAGLVALSLRRNR